jgi:hypothetical protein
MDKRDELQKEIKFKEQQLLKELTNIEESTLSSVTILQKQGDQLNKIKKDVDVINDNLSVSEKLIKSMREFASFMFISKNNIEEKIEKNNDKRNIQEDNKESDQRKSWSFFSSKTSINSPFNTKKEEIEINSFDIMAEHLEKIKNNVDNQKEIIKQHNETLEKISGDTDQASHKITKINRNIKKIT